MKPEKSPPALFLRFFRWYCDPELKDTIEGDLIELYKERIKGLGKRRADIQFIKDVLLLFRPGIIRLKRTEEINHYVMIQNNFKIAFRSLWKNKASSLINIFGLTTGIASCLLILLFIQNELSYDDFQPNKNRIARVIMEYSFDGSTESVKGDFTSTKVAPVFSRTFPEVVKGIRMTHAEMIVHDGDQLLTEKRFLFADSSFFDAFSYELIKGNVSKALHGPYKVVLTESTARRYFDQENPVGKTLLMGSNARPYEITAVVKDYPENSQFRFDMLASFSSLGNNQEETYFDANYTTYLLLTDANAIHTLQAKLHPFMEKETKGSGSTIHFYLEQFDQIHLHSEYGAFEANTNITYLYILSAVALLIVIIVCFTYINLSTAKSVERAREVGIRKVSGAARSQLFWQFIGESLVVCGLSVITSFAVAALALPYFNQLIEKNLELRQLFTPAFLLVALAITVAVSFFAGGYPAVILSRLQPVRVLKGVFKNTTSARWVQQSLIVFQFAISVFMIVSTVIIQNQLQFIQHQNLGYDREQIIRLRVDWDMPFAKAEVLKQQMKTIPGITSASRCAGSPVRISSGYTMRKGSATETEQIPVTANPIDQTYIETTGMQLIAGTHLTEQDMKEAAVENWEDRRFHFILNESAARKLGWTPEEAVGQEIVLNRPGRVRGVVKDFYFQSMHEHIEPLVLFTENHGNTLLLKVEGDDIQTTLTQTQSKWKELVPNRPFEYQFLDDDYNRMYHSEQQLGKVMKLFAGIAMVLAALGLFGLSSYMIQQRTKEIGIRKALGASLINLLSVLSGNFLRLVLVAIVVGSPLAYLIMSRWLSDFVYRIDLSWWMFFVAGLATIIIALLTVSIHGMRASRANPVKSLRSE